MCLCAVETETEAVEEDVFPEEAAPCSVSPLHAESLDFPDTPVSPHRFTLQLYDVLIFPVVRHVVMQRERERERHYMHTRGKPQKVLSSIGYSSTYI